MVGGGILPRRKGFVPSGSLLDQAHLLPSLGRGLCPEGEPRNNREVFVDKPVPKLLPPTRGERERWESRVSWLELQLSLQRDSSLGWLPLTFSRLPRLCLEAAENLLSPSSFPLKGEGCRGPRTEKPRLQDLF